tara:strand:+ start:591 stop:857 length:267 start_codon:yes stop_codon:yes gene_type:complete
MLKTPSLQQKDFLKLKYLVLLLYPLKQLLKFEMAYFKHIVYYRVNGAGPILEATVVASDRDTAESDYQSANPTHKIERILTTVNSTLN